MLFDAGGVLMTPHPATLRANPGSAASGLERSSPRYAECARKAYYTFLAATSAKARRQRRLQGKQSR